MSESPGTVAETAAPVHERTTVYARALHIGFFSFCAIAVVLLTIPAIHLPWELDAYMATKVGATFCWLGCLFLKPRNPWLLMIEFVLLLFVMHWALLMLIVMIVLHLAGFAS